MICHFPDLCLTPHLHSCSFLLVFSYNFPDLLPPSLPLKYCFRWLHSILLCEYAIIYLTVFILGGKFCYFQPFNTLSSISENTLEIHEFLCKSCFLRKNSCKCNLEVQRYMYTFFFFFFWYMYTFKVEPNIML